MDYFKYKNGNLFAEDVAIRLIVGKIGTPAYIYSKATFTDHLRKIRKAFRQLDTLICYSVKACSNINILRLAARVGSGFDVVSGGELYRIQQTGGDPAKVVYAGVGKTDKEIIEALKAGVGYFNIESQAELENLILLAKKTKRKTKAALRVNPDVRADTHKYVTTGIKATKFGIDIEHAQNVFKSYGNNPWVNLCGIHVHLGSGGKTIDPYCQAIRKVLPLIDTLRAYGYKIEVLDIGGGFGADYESDTVPSAADYASGIIPLLKNKGLKLILEPGKTIAANAGILVTTVLYTKQSGDKKFIIVDAGMNDLIRPCLYDAFHFIWPTRVAKKFVPSSRNKSLHLRDCEVFDVVGPICESADFFAKDRALPPIKRGDILAVFTAGAYAFTMSSNYNSRGRAAEVLVDGNKFKVIRKRESYEDLISLEK
jgi:diaminopimelate decarboxylase